MRSIKFKILPPPAILRNDVECFRIAEYTGDAELAVKVSPDAVPGIVIQHNDGRSAIESIVTPSGSTCPPTLFLYGPGIEPSVMHYNRGPYTTTQVVLKPHGLKTLFGINASVLSNNLAEPTEFSAGQLNDQLMEAHNDQE